MICGGMMKVAIKMKFCDILQMVKHGNFLMLDIQTFLQALVILA